MIVIYQNHLLNLIIVLPMGVIWEKALSVYVESEHHYVSCGAIVCFRMPFQVNNSTLSFFGPGEHLRLCPQDYTCCSSQMEETLALQSERDFLKAVEDSSQFLLTTFTQRYRRFDGKKMNFYVFLLSV